MRGHEGEAAVGVQRQRRGRAGRSAWALAGALALLVAGAAGAEAAQFNYPVSGRLTSTYYSSRSYGYHRALDIAASSGTAIRSARSGRVTFAGWSGGYGNLIIVDHGAGYTTYYAHQSRFAARSGQSVSTGQVIGYVGSTGNSTGPHLHFEVRRWGSKQYLPGSGGQTVTRQRGIGHSYSGLSTLGGSSGSSGSSGGSAGVKRVTASALNVRSGPGTGNRSIGLVYRNQVYVSTRTSGGWHKIWFDGRQGWAYGGYLASKSGVQKREVTASALNVRTGASTGYRRVGTAPRGATYARNGSSGSWIRIHFGGHARWFHGGYTRAR